MQTGTTLYYRTNGTRLADMDRDAPCPLPQDVERGTVAEHSNTNWDGAVTLVGHPADVAALRAAREASAAEAEARAADAERRCAIVAEKIGAEGVTVVDQLTETPSCPVGTRYLAVAVVAGVAAEVIVGAGSTATGAVADADRRGAKAVAAVAEAA